MRNLMLPEERMLLTFFLDSLPHQLLSLLLNFGLHLLFSPSSYFRVLTLIFIT
jgi:hypothetical protein